MDEPKYPKNGTGENGVRDMTCESGLMIPLKESALERTFAFQVMASGLPKPEREVRFDARRKWRFDFAWSVLRVAVELEGGIWNNGRHVRGQGFENDCEKLNFGQANGWRIFRFTPKMVNSGQAIDFLRREIFFKKGLDKSGAA